MPNYMTEFSPDNNSHVYQIKDEEAAPITLLKDTVGWVGKNKIPFPYNGFTEGGSGLIVTINSDTSITINGTLSEEYHYYLSKRHDYDFKLSAGSYLVSGGISNDVYLGIAKNNVTGDASQGGSGLGNDKGSGASFTINELSDIQIVLYVKAGTYSNVRIYPMIRDASIVDSTYEPYHKSVEAEIEQVYADNGVLGASNFIYVERETRTYNGVTFTRIDDKSFSLSGTATGDANLDITRYVNPPIGRKYTYSIEEEGANKVDYIRVTKDGTEVLKSSEKSADIDISSAASNGYVFQITVVSGKTYNTTIKPMLTLASDTYKGFRPYAMTNRELTEMMTVEESAVTDIVSGATVKTNEMGNHLVKIGKVVTLNLSLGDVTATAWDTILFKIPKAYAPRYDTRIKTMENQMVRIDPIYNDGDARVKLNTSVTSQNVSVFATWITP